ncbi:YdcF family protein [Nostocaceae cyanobacterium CENA369]|uniref:YdcF family protein n=1 Tax=Dendronalium phyllosphericum CENA369 TaxID=1725256 RepID=A0A8J7LBV8_9NOST|nr:ElyC/SanA/YdcF family protein [Dendronalium phyllosphericum]MBH8572182.1 YdcF family protein [Dendronalium phyllosphericum CENA369]
MQKNPQAQKLPQIRLIKRQEIWTLTAQGWLLFLATSTASMFFAIAHLYPFLAVTSPIEAADILVVDGWISDYALEQAAAEFKRGSYRQLITLGVTVDNGYYLAEYKNFAEIAATTLKKLGVPQEKIIAIPTPNVVKNRTNASAGALLQWITESNSTIESINLFTTDAHARRSWLIHKKILSPKIKVGIISAEPPYYDPKKWWNSSEGVRVIISEIIAYLYALLVN